MEFFYYRHPERSLARSLRQTESKDLWFRVTDADDEMVLEAAINGQAKAIVTHNR